MQLFRQLAASSTVALLLGVGPAAALKPLTAIPNYLTDDSALVTYVESDRRLQSVQNCRAPNLRRAKERGVETFTYAAICDMQPLSNGLCRQYRVVASGTVGVPETYSAFVRQVTLTTLCDSGPN